MPIINAFPEGGGSGGTFDNDTFVVYETLTREQRYSSSSSSTVTNIGYVDATSKSQLIIYAGYANSTAGNQTAVLYAVKDATVTLYSSTSGTTGLLDTISFTKGHKYTVKKYAPSSSGSRYVKITDETTETDLYNETYTTNNFRLVFS